MQESLKSELNKLNIEEAEELLLSINFAKNLRVLKSKFNISDEIFCKLFIVSFKELPAFLSGGYDYSLKDMSRYQVHLSELEALKVKEEILNEEQN